MYDSLELKQTTLASYALMKSLTDCNQYKDSYEILADFIRYIIVSKRLHEFTITEIINILQTEFGFDNIPLPVVRTSIKKIRECIKQKDNYVVSDDNLFTTYDFHQIQQASSNRTNSIIQELLDFAKKYSKDDFKSDQLENALIKYLLDDSATIDQRYSDIISKFILSVENRSEIKRQIAEIREGSILFCGLSYNISELGSITSELTLFLDTEILFNLMGYNGSLYQRISDDFLKQVQSANLKRKIIKLRYFEEVKFEIEDFFNSAENIIKGKAEPILNSAMKAILNGCETVGDITDKEADFFSTLQYQYNIYLDEKASYYTETDYKYNIETIPDGYPDDERSREAVKFISHINKLRKGNSSTDYTTCKYLLITETRRIQELSNAMRNNHYGCGFVLPTSVITNILWYKLGFGFSKQDYPVNTDVSYKAKEILSGEITNKIARIYDEVKQEYLNGNLDKEQVASRIIMLRNKQITPDELTSENIDELMDFSVEYITSFEEGIKQNEVDVKEKQGIIEKLESEQLITNRQNNELSEKIKQLTKEHNTDNVIIKRQEETIKNQLKQLENYEKAEKKKQQIKQRRNYVLRFIWSIIWKSVLLVVVLYLMNRYVKDLPDSIRTFVDLAGVIGLLISLYKGSWKQYKDNMKHLN